METDPGTTFEVGDFVWRNPATWIFNELDEYGRGRGIGMVVTSKEELEEGKYRIEWPGGWSVERGDHLLPTEMGTGMHVENVAPIQEWAGKRGYLLRGMPTNAQKLNLLALDGNELVGEIAILQVNEEPASFFMTTCVGRMILDESWADRESLPRCLDKASRLIHGKHKVENGKPDWGFAFGYKETNCEWVPNET